MKFIRGIYLLTLISTSDLALQSDGSFLIVEVLWYRTHRKREFEQNPDELKYDTAQGDADGSGGGEG